MIQEEILVDELKKSRSISKMITQTLLPKGSLWDSVNKQPFILGKRAERAHHPRPYES